MGSHGPGCHKRSSVDREPFQPERATNVLVQCGHQALTNACDNAVASTDHLLASTIVVTPSTGASSGGPTTTPRCST